ncbi:NADPH:quinone oxidoreductase family protein [Hoeflea sp. CAU 1731]
MKAIRCNEFSGIDALSIEDVAPDKLLDNHLRVKVHAAGINFPDSLIVAGRYQVKPELPFTPGMELSGEVVEVGNAVEGFAVGDRVSAVVTWGAFAEEAVVEAERAFKIPEALDWNIAAAFPLAYMTAWHGLMNRAGMSAGDRVLVLGASGGVGLAALDICRHIAAQAIAAASSFDKLKVCADYGAQHLINYAEQDLRSVLKEQFGRAGLDIVCDPVGGDHFEAAFRSLGYGGRHLVIGFAGGAIPNLPVNLALLGERNLMGVYWADYANRNHGARPVLGAKLAGLILDGKLDPKIARIGTLDEAVEMLHTFSKRTAVGKLVIRFT